LANKCWCKVDCIIDTGSTVIPVEIKSGSKVTFSALRGLSSFIESYQDRVKQAHVIPDGRMPENLTDKITAMPWRFL